MELLSRGGCQRHIQEGEWCIHGAAAFLLSRAKERTAQLCSQSRITSVEVTSRMRCSNLCTSLLLREEHKAHKALLPLIQECAAVPQGLSILYKENINKI